MEQFKQRLGILCRLYFGRGWRAAIIPISTFILMTAGSAAGFAVYRIGLADLPPLGQNGLAAFAAGAVSFAYFWLLYGALAPQSRLERLVGFVCAYLLIVVVAQNVVLYLELLFEVPDYYLNRVERFWLRDGALFTLTGLVGIVVLVLFTRMLKSWARWARPRITAWGERLDREYADQHIELRWQAIVNILAADIVNRNRQNGAAAKAEHLSSLDPVRPLEEDGDDQHETPALVLQAPPSLGDKYEWRRNDAMDGWNLWAIRLRSVSRPEDNLGFIPDTVWHRHLKYLSEREFKDLFLQQVMQFPDAKFICEAPTFRKGETFGI